MFLFFLNEQKTNIIQAICDDYGRICGLFGPGLGAQHDMSIYRQSMLKRRTSEYLDEHQLILYDGAAAKNEIFLKSPAYRKKEHEVTLKQRVLGQMHAEARCIIERSFGSLKHRFAIARYYSWNRYYFDVHMRSIFILNNILLRENPLDKTFEFVE